MDFNFYHSDEKPEWLSEWLTPNQLNNKFADGIKAYAYRVLNQDKVRRMEWDTTRLITRIGSQRVTWQLINDRWNTTCSCGFANSSCVHAYVAAKVFNELASNKGWLSLPSTNQRNVRERTRPAPARPQRQPSYASKYKSQPVLTPATTPVKPGEIKLDVEVDFHHDPQYATIRIYMVKNEMRRLTRIQEIYNYGLRERTTSAQKSPWPEMDHSFLKWLRPKLTRHESVIRNLKVIKVPRREFNNEWLKHWQNHPGRFIDRDTQKAFGCAGKPARFVIELRDAGDRVEIAALIVPPRGTPKPVHEVLKLLSDKNKKEAIVDGQLLELDFPLSASILQQAFGTKSPKMRWEHVAEHLPHLLENRLDLLQGPLITKTNTMGNAKLILQSDGADFMLSGKVNDTSVYATGGAPAGSIKRVGRKFEVTCYTRETYQPIQEIMREFKGHKETNRYRIPGSPDTILKMRDYIKQLPDNITVNYSPEVEPVFNIQHELKAEVILGDNKNFVNMHVNFRVGDCVISAADLNTMNKNNHNIIRTRAGQWLQIDPAELAEVKKHLAELGLSNTTSEKIFRSDAAELAKKLANGSTVIPAATGQELVHRLVTEPPPDLLQMPDSLKDILRHYQQDGFDFLSNRCAHGIGPILADDMGLGKTLQILTLLEANRLDHKRLNKNERGALVVCPASLVSVWLDQAKQFCPGLKCTAYKGSPSKRVKIPHKNNWDILVANYSLVRNDIESLKEFDFSFVVLDEAQYIKNPDSQIAQAVKALKTSHPVALTGTPLENRLLDLWSIMDFLNPGFLNDSGTFTSLYETGGNRNTLIRKLAPIMLRRTKDAVAPELPPKTEQVLHVELEPEQMKLYKAQLVKAREDAKDQGPMAILTALTRLRQICCDPQLVLKNNDAPESAKRNMVMEQIRKLIDENHSVLIFSQFKSMLNILEKQLCEENILNYKITGDTPTSKRPDIVKEFNNSDDSAVFLLSLKAAGTGLTLTKADYVFIYDPWWNPAAEQQAIDRTHRIGQDKPVIAYRMVCSGTVEEKVLALQEEKAQLFAEVIETAEQTASSGKLTKEDLNFLLS